MPRVTGQHARSASDAPAGLVREVLAAAGTARNPQGFHTKIRIAQDAYIPNLGSARSASWTSKLLSNRCIRLQRSITWKACSSVMVSERHRLLISIESPGAIDDDHRYPHAAVLDDDGMVEVERTASRDVEDLVRVGMEIAGLGGCDYVLRQMALHLVLSLS
jgi:hypothetical protein